MANAEKIQQVLDYITSHPSEWNQDVYAKRTACGTAGCVAGLTVVLNGHELHFRRRNDDIEQLSFSAIRKGMEYGLTDISSLAQEELELTTDECYLFFASGNSLDDLWRLANQFTGGEVTRNG